MARGPLDRLAWVYIGIILAWTVALVGGMVFLFTHRELPCIRMRRLPLLFTGLVALHIYGIIGLLVYVLGPLLLCSAEFWLMSIYLPFGFAMFHAANSQFLHIARRQKQYAHLEILNDHSPLEQEKVKQLADSRWRRIHRAFERVDGIDGLVVYIGLGLIVQLLLTLLVFFGSRKFHPSYGMWDWNVQSNVSDIRAECSRGWEWWLSIVWQVFWAWIYAPYNLWKSRDVHDVHGWRLQTICCCLAGLPASPLWLAGLYAPQMASVNARFVPPAWFSVSIFAMEVVTIGFPIVEIFKTHKLRQETLAAIKRWEDHQQAKSPSISACSVSECSSKGGSRTDKLPSSQGGSITRKTSWDSQKSDMYTMAGLENALRTNPLPLLQFAALKDFSGENISFLTHLADWQRSWQMPKATTAQLRREQFTAAVCIYAHFVSPSYSEFPINISCKNITGLRDMFEDAASLLFRKTSMSATSSATPFNDVSADSDSTTDLKSGINLAALGLANLKSAAHMGSGHGEMLAHIAMPEAFDETVFDAAEKEIKYLVLTNTWPKFVNATCETQPQDADKGGRHGNWFHRAILCSA